MTETEIPGQNPVEQRIIDFFATEAFGDRSLVTGLAVVGATSEEYPSLSEVAADADLEVTERSEQNIVGEWVRYVAHRVVEAAANDELDALVEDAGLTRPGHQIPNEERPHTNITEQKVSDTIEAAETLFGPKSAILEQMMSSLQIVDSDEVVDGAVEHMNRELAVEGGVDAAFARAGYFTAGYVDYYADSYSNWKADQNA
ncbi:MULTISPECIES: hypothetical protein [unclassified Haloferax]|jgi:hypothetical protein|uniref:hypothetical protein n=1 Tax=unclassified Haloferax TaxID=2625095 RepID=UPI0028749C90|nr:MULTISPECIES: hypothetical protein [unclassified Haloferax]MDS0243083.1 hypothetical protein [Haloferax sp. S2CR25]MDS0446204.1 hypothetical protein [Haloferax sp. S2CR25-2]